MYINLESIKSMSDIVVNIVIFFTFIMGFKIFKYKLDSEDRKLYIESYQAVHKILQNIATNGAVKLNDINELALEIQKAELYLHKDIFNFIKNIHTIAIQAYTISQELENLKGEERCNLNKKCTELISKIYNYNIECPKLYRKNIITEFYK